MKCKPLLKSHLRPNTFAIMDKGYDSDVIRAYVNQLGGIAVIAVNSSRSKSACVAFIASQIWAGSGIVRKQLVSERRCPSLFASPPTQSKTRVPTFMFQYAHAHNRSVLAVNNDVGKLLRRIRRKRSLFW